MLDYIVDGQFKAVQDLDERIESLQDDLFDDSRDRVREVQRKSFDLRRDLILLRRFVLPMREVVNGLMRETKIVNETLMPYYQDVYDHVLRATEWTESLRDLVSTVLETNLTIQGNRMNLIMKQVTSWAAIIAVPTAVTGFYGQNIPYPGFGHDSGLITSSHHHRAGFEPVVLGLPAQGLAVTRRSAAVEDIDGTRNHQGDSHQRDP